jgi:flagellar biosynthesis GTPase FlhF
VVAEGARDLVADDVAQHAAERRRDHAHQHRHQRRRARSQRDLRATGAEQAQAQRVGPLHRAFGQREVAPAQEKHRHHAQRQQAPQPVGMLDPEKRPAVEQHVAQRAAAERGQPRHHAHAHRVQLAPRRLDQPGQRERDGGHRLHRDLRVGQGEQGEVGSHGPGSGWAAV